MYVSGVFNGATSKSIRARIPATTAIDVAGSVPYASALDLKKGTVILHNKASTNSYIFDVQVYSTSDLPSRTVCRARLYRLSNDGTSVILRTLNVTLTTVYLLQVCAQSIPFVGCA